jgi:hypothetical protein
MTEKGYVVDAQRRAVQEHYQRMGESVSLLRTGDFWNTEYELGEELPKVSLIIDARGQALKEWLDCLPRLLAITSYPDLEICFCQDDDTSHPLPDRSVLRIRSRPGQSAGEAYQAAVQSCRAK